MYITASCYYIASMSGLFLKCIQAGIKKEKEQHDEHRLFGFLKRFVLRYLFIP